MTAEGSIHLGISGNNYTFHLTGSQTLFAQNDIMSGAQLNANRSE
jgi:hypothetical protein